MKTQIESLHKFKTIVQDNNAYILLNVEIDIQSVS